MATMEKDQDTLIEQFVAARNKNIGKVIIPPVGEMPPVMECWYGTIMNEHCTTDVIRHYADAIGDLNPLWRSEDYAKKTRWGGIIAPPTIMDTIIQPYAGHMVSDDELREMPFKSFFTLPNGSTRWMYQVVRPGDRFHAIQVDMGLTELPRTRSEPACQFDDCVRRIIYNQREEIVSVHDRHMEVVINQDLQGEPYWGWRKRRRVTDGERDAIYRAYETLTIRGSETLFWEDVKVGEEMPPLTVGPLTAYDCVAAYGGIVQGHAVAFDAEWQRIKRAFHFHYLDPEINAWTCSGICHMVDGVGHANVFSGGPAVAFYFQNEGLFGRMIINWMGDDGFLKMLDDRMPVIPIVGDVLCNKGKVTGKSVENGEHLVDLAVRCENLDGEVLLHGTATVRLPSRHDFKEVKK